jgi:hypothetical protein
MGKIVTLTTDFGSNGPYVGALKGALLSVDPGAVIVDITHEIEPGNIAEGAFVLAGAYSAFPSGTVHVGVVDPGVGTKRKAVLIETEKYCFVGPDNGLFSYLFSGTLSEPFSNDPILKRINITENKYFGSSVSATFHGRDIFAPVAAHLGLGVKPEAFGPALDSVVTLPAPKPSFAKGADGSTLAGEATLMSALSGEIIYIDRFGNCITNIKEADIDSYFQGVEPARLKVVVKSVEMSGLCRTYGDCSRGGPVALIGSSGFLEVAIAGGNGAKEFGVAKGEAVMVCLSGSGGSPTLSNGDV